jgi:hypothetical protein
MALPVAIAIIVGVIAGWAAKHIYQMGQDMTARLIDAEKRISQLEQAQAKRLPYKTADEIENSIAAILYMQQDADRKAELIDNALNHLQLARGNGKRN